ncbi:uncharacterized protein LOC122854984 isoform X2 [Aphidius gifuensis]|uniref:uncharacterized protein LOC122854984 isoform X2 n=1 Tax=Aphidius gifuensis TaxID=684658 RepID=UPI001CDCB6B5|nr:uncharacterized protein LOC122854984 isoform X2 [Aphidius gifuensis]
MSSSTAFQFVKITCIKNFSVEFWSSSTTNKRSEKVYVLQRDKSVRETCQVLAIADSRDEIEEISRSKRWSVPKLSTSVIDNESDDLSPRNSSDSEEEKKSRKRLKSSKAVGLKQAQQGICEKYRKINKLDEYTDCDESQSPINKEKTSDNFYFSTSFDYTKDPLSNSILSDIENINQNHKTCKKQLQFGSKNQTEFDAWATREVSSPSATETKLELAAARSQVKFWKNKYDNLLESKAFPLSEETGQIIIKLIKKSSIPETNNSTDVSLNEETIKKQCSEVLVSENHMARTRKDKPLIEEDEAAILTSLLKNQFKDAGECVKTIIKSLWTDDELAERVVRKNAKINKKALTFPDILVAVQNPDSVSFFSRYFRFFTFFILFIYILIFR